MLQLHGIFIGVPYETLTFYVVIFLVVCEVVITAIYCIQLHDVGQQYKVLQTLQHLLSGGEPE